MHRTIRNVILPFFGVSLALAGDGVPQPQDMPSVEAGVEKRFVLDGLEWATPTNEVWMIEAYASMDWRAWDAKVEERLAQLAEAASHCPPMPEGVVSYVGQPVEELSLAACTNAVPPAFVGDVKTWTFRVMERVAPDGTRSLITHANNIVFHEQPVSASFDPEAWSLAAYGEGGALPAWIESNAERRAEWFRLRGRERLGLSFTMVEPGRLQDYKVALEAQAEALRKAQEEADGRSPQVLAFGATEMAVTPSGVTFGVYNPERVDIDVIGFSTLTCPQKSYLGRIPAKGKERLWFETVRPADATTYFYRFLNGTLDSDGDGISDGMELGYFGTDPHKRDTAGSRMDDWRKIFVYGMDATVADSDGDGLPDGWELLHGLDPQSAEGANGAEGDPDEDGLDNRTEFLYGTHPQKADTDDDGLADREETGFAQVFHHVKGIDTSAAEEIVSEAGTVLINFPFPIRLGGRQYTQALAADSGVLTFLNEALPRGEAPEPMGRALAEIPFRTDTHTLALYWGPIEWKPGYMSTIRAVSLEHEGQRKIIVEYLNFAQFGKDARTLGRIQVEIPEQGDVVVHYTTLQGDMNASDAVLGAQRPGGAYAELFAIGDHQKDAVVTADAVVYHFGSGTNPTQKDTDGDGVADGAEIQAGTSPSSDDNDFDGMPDGWETTYGLNPNLADGGLDPDGDTLTNLMEYRLGTDPTAWDSDGDTLPDAAEVGTFIRRSHVKALDTSSGTITYAYAKREVDGYKRAPLPFPVTLDGMEYAYVALNADGFITFIPSEDAPISPERPLKNEDMATAPFDARYPTIALYWDDLMLAESFMSTMRIVLLTDDQGGRTAVIEYLNIAKQKGIAFLATPEPCTSLARIQVILPENAAAKGIEVRYPTLQGTFDGTSATLGAQHRGGTHPGQFAIAHDEPNAIALGDSITYFFGLGTDPSLADTDFDGLRDDAEFEAGCDPHEPDSDGDGMSDGWETCHDRSPTEPNDGTLDTDGDGLTDAQEAAYKTDPTKADTDGDGVNDLTEIHQSSDPTDKTDEGLANSRRKLTLTFGDDSGSHSEKYVLAFVQLAGEGNQTTYVFNEAYGRLQTHDVFLRPDAVYRVTMKHLASNLDTPDRDYTLSISLPEEGNILLEDEDELIGSATVEDGEAFPGEGKEVYIYCFDVRLTPDYNRDGVIDAADETLATQGKPLCMWVNNDWDFDIENGVNDGDERSQFQETENDARVNGKSDMDDFFPVRASLGQALPFYLQMHEDRSLDFRDCKQFGVLWCTQANYSIERFYSLSDASTDACFGYGDEKRWDAHVSTSNEVPVPFHDWHPLPPWLQKNVREGKWTQFVFFLEAQHKAQAPLTLSITSAVPILPDRQVLDLCALPVTIANVEEMYATLNLRNPSHTYAAAVTPPLAHSDSVVAFIHGYSVSEDDAEGWFNALFKRLWQSGLNAHFCGITWHGDDEGNLPDYYRNVRNAFVAAGRLNTALRTVPLAGYARTSIMAHSLGNMVVSAAVQDYDAPIDAYFMLNAAVPAEAYDATPLTHDFPTNGIPRGLVHDDWRAVAPQAWANFWHRHFLPQEGYTPTPADTARASLTWHGRFKDVLTKPDVDVYNYYSAGATENGDSLGDEVFELMDRTPDPTTGFEWFKNKGRYSWQKQECYKGRHTSFWDFKFAASDTMGWGVEDGTSPPTSPEAYRTAPYFHRNPSLILQNDASAILAQRDPLLAYGIPAMTRAVGTVELDDVKSNTNLQESYVNREEEPWARGQWSLDEPLRGRWLHSDIKDVSYPFTRILFKDILEKGKLK